ncbi:hypothetical protein ABER75_24990 [Niallia taxi]|uniref:Uncharacterized protein n=1 Tax=Niallia taxi TaxID=2499688 RepID=A0A3S2TUV4_9BACI|nr:hypothetical protein [Niallia taxi]MCM3214196.1 hypothetical protein [Niallia taxi]MDK8640841.1 hypothetical protein [Niallia taxi]MED4052767.1 hypothetical protein [Niallia taxi]MED4120122.1 hypothetical protein [Niallia taxi]RVT58292.1 hypothetical protein EM808_22515 [Niallia taxi]
MPKKPEASLDGTAEKESNVVPLNKESSKDQIAELNRMLAAVMNYISDDEVEEIDVTYLLQNTEGLKEWWDEFKESNRKDVEEEIKKSLNKLSLKELEQIREQIKEKQE